jgi:hypothetical protein
MHVLQGASRSCTFDAEAESSLSGASTGPIMKPPCPVAPGIYSGIVWDSLGYSRVGLRLIPFENPSMHLARDLLLTIPSREPGEYGGLRPVLIGVSENRQDRPR